MARSHGDAGAEPATDAGTQWGALDYLIVDMPPGTGDTQLTLSQRVPVSGAVIVTTPQDIALPDARKGLRMFQKVEVAVLGVVENMSTHVCSNCGHEEHIFGEPAAASVWREQYGVPLLGSLPLDRRIREEADGGQADGRGRADERRSPGVSRGGAAGGGRACARTQRLQSRLFPKITIEED